MSYIDEHAEWLKSRGDATRRIRAFARHALVVAALAVATACTGGSGSDDARASRDAPGSTSQPASTTTIAPLPTVLLEPDPDATEDVALIGTTQLTSGSITQVRAQSCLLPILSIGGGQNGSASKHFPESTDPRRLSMRIPLDLLPGTYALTVRCDGDSDVPGPAHRLDVEIVEGDVDGDVEPVPIFDVDPNIVCVPSTGEERVRRRLCEERSRFPERVWWMNDDSHGPALTKADVGGLLESLWVDTPVTFSRAEQKGVPFYPDESFLLLDWVTIDPERGLQLVTSDYSELGNRMLDDLPAFVEDVSNGLHDESEVGPFLDAALSNIAYFDYITDGTRMWLSAEAQAEYAELRFEWLQRLRVDDAITPEEANEIAIAKIAFDSRPNWHRRWIERGILDGPAGYPRGLASSPELTDVIEALVEAGLIEAEIHDGEVQDVQFSPNVVLTQVERDWHLAQFEVRFADSHEVIASLTVNTMVNQVAHVDLGSVEFRMGWAEELPSDMVPEESDVLTVEETAAWLGIKPECLGPEDSVVNPPDSIPAWCVN